MRLAAFLLLTLGTVMTGTVLAAGPDDEFETIAERQRRLREGLDAVKSRLLQLADEIEAKQPDEARRLREAWDRLERLQVQSDMEEVVRLLTAERVDDIGARLRTDEAVRKLLEVLSVLEEEVEPAQQEVGPELDRLRADIQALEELIDTQRGILSETADLRDVQDALRKIERAIGEVDGLAEDQKDLRDDPGATRHEGTEASRLGAALEQVRALLAEQRRLAAPMQPLLQAEAEERELDGARQGAAELSDRLEAVEDGAGAEVREAIRKEVSELAGKVRGKTAGSDSAEGELTPKEEAIAGAAEALEKAASTLGDSTGGDPEEAVQSLREAEEILRSAADEALRERGGDFGRMARRQGGLAVKADAIGEIVPDRPESEEPGGARSSLSAAAEAMRAAADGLRAGGAEDPIESQQAALDALEKVRGILEGQQERLAGRSPEGRAADRQGELEAGARDVARELAEVAESLPGAEGEQTGEASEALGKAGEKMGEAGEELRKGLPSEEGEEDQTEALSRLADAREALEQAKEGLEEQLRREKLESIAREQEAARAEAERLAERLSQEGRSGRESEAGSRMENAGGKMEQAEDRLRTPAESPTENPNVEIARTRQEEALDELEQAQQNLQEKEAQYEEMRQRQELFSLREVLDEMIKRQGGINASTLMIEGNREKNKVYSRADRIGAKELAAEQRRLRAIAEEMEGKLREEEIPVYAFIVEGTRVDMGTVARRLEEPDTGPFTQRVQGEIEESLVELRDALKMELRERRQEGQPGGQQRAHGPQRLIPPVAELKMLELLQERLHRKTRDVDDAIRLRGGKANALHKRLVSRLARSQGNLGGVFKEMVESILKEVTGEEEPEEAEEE